MRREGGKVRIRRKLVAVSAWDFIFPHKVDDPTEIKVYAGILEVNLMYFLIF